MAVKHLSTEKKDKSRGGGLIKKKKYSKIVSQLNRENASSDKRGGDTSRRGPCSEPATNSRYSRVRRGTEKSIQHLIKLFERRK